VRTVLPVAITLTKIGINILQQITYCASFTDDSVFPFLLRNASIGVCNFFARFAALLAPLVSSLSKPLPELILLGAMALAFLVAFNLPLEDYDEKQSELTPSNASMDQSQMLKSNA